MRINGKRAVVHFAYLCVGILFFLLHGYIENDGLPSIETLASLGLTYLLTVAFFFVLALWWLRNSEKAFILTFVCAATYFLFGACKDTLYANPFTRLISRYIILLPACSVLWLGAFIYLKRRTADVFGTVVRYLHALLVVVTLVEAVFWAGHARFKPPAYASPQVTSIPDSLRHAQHPDIYWIIFDMYPSSESLRKHWGFSNPLDSQLQAIGFTVLHHARSNYNYTPFSLCSMLEMGYLPYLRDERTVTAREQMKAIRDLYDNALVRTLEANGYNIDNYSLFDFRNHPTKGYRFFGSLERDLIDDQTLAARFRKDVGWYVAEKWQQWVQRRPPAYRDQQDVIETDRYYQQLIQGYLLHQHEWQSMQRPVFSILHVMLPHEPYIYDANGNLVLKPYNTRSSDFIPQVAYTNKVMTNLLGSLLQLKRGKEQVVIVQGDHGYKFDPADPRFATDSHSILYAFYSSSPGKPVINDSMTAVNSFRLLLNHYFNSGMPLLKDTSYLFRYNQSYGDGRK